MKEGVYVLDRTNDSYGHYFRGRVLCDRRSRFQRIVVVATEKVGRVLMLDDAVNLVSTTEAFYHEPMAHVPLAQVEGDALRVLIIGGGDFGVARQVLRHRRVASLDLCELDAEVLRVAREHFPELAACESDDRLRVRVGDGLHFLDETEPETFDVVLVDSTDPYWTAQALVGEDFYRRLGRSLRPGGVFTQNICNPMLYPGVWPEVLRSARTVFPVTTPFLPNVPFFDTGPWGILMGGRDRRTIGPDPIDEEFLASIDASTMTAEIVRSWFSIPPAYQSFLEPT